MNVGYMIKTGSRNLSKFVVKESPSILAGLAAGGVITTTVLGITATPKALRLIAEEEEARANDPNTPSCELTKIDIIKIVWPVYVPTLAAGLTTIGCIIWGNSISLGRNAALASVYAVSEKTFREYQQKVVETIGEKKEEQIRDDIAQDRLNKNPASENQIIVTGKGENLFYDSLSGRYFKSDMETVRKVVNDFNYELLLDMYKPLNEFYYELGLEGTEMGRDTGWNVETGVLDIKYSAKLADNGIPCVVMDYKISPKKL